MEKVLNSFIQANNTPPENKAKSHKKINLKMQEMLANVFIPFCSCNSAFKYICLTSLPCVHLTVCNFPALFSAQND